MRSGIAAARARGKRPKSDRVTPNVLGLIAKGRGDRLARREVGLSKNIVVDVVEHGRRFGNTVSHALLSRACSSGTGGKPVLVAGSNR